MGALVCAACSILAILSCTVSSGASLAQTDDVKARTERARAAGDLRGAFTITQE